MKRCLSIGETISSLTDKELNACRSLALQNVAQIQQYISELNQELFRRERAR